MKVKTLEVLWHSQLPVFSVDFHPSQPRRFATAGQDKDVKLWNLTDALDSDTPVEYVASLSRHQSSVNCVRFSPNGTPSQRCRSA